MKSKVWFITGASRGFGRVWAEAALKRGGKVAATVRKLTDIADLKECFGDAVLPLALDVTDAEQVRQAVQKAHVSNAAQGEPQKQAIDRSRSNFM